MFIINNKRGYLGRFLFYHDDDGATTANRSLPSKLTIWTIAIVWILLVATLQYAKYSLITVNSNTPPYQRPEWYDLLRDPLRNSLLEYVRIRSRRIGYNLTEAERFCVGYPYTRLDNCTKLNWKLIQQEMSEQMLTVLATEPEPNVYCFRRTVENTCFDVRESREKLHYKNDDDEHEHEHNRDHQQKQQQNTTLKVNKANTNKNNNDDDDSFHYEVWTQKLDLSAISWKMEPKYEVRYRPKMILAQSAVEFMLVMSHDEYCNLNLHDNVCLHYDY